MEQLQLHLNTIYLKEIWGGRLILIVGHYLFKACERGISAVESLHGHRPAGETHREDHTVKNTTRYSVNVPGASVVM